MSIASDIRNYADTAVEQGKQVIDQAQTQFNGVNKQANEFVAKFRDNAFGARGNVSQLTAKANDAVADLRAQAEKAVNLDAIKTAIEPYLAQARGYSTTVTDRAEDLLTTVKNDKRVAFVVAKAEALTETVVVTLNERVVKPVQSVTGRGSKPAAKPAAKATTVKATPAASAKPASKAAGTATAARKSTARKASTARKTTKA